MGAHGYPNRYAGAPIPLDLSLSARLILPLRLGVRSGRSAAGSTIRSSCLPLRALVRSFSTARPPAALARSVLHEGPMGAAQAGTAGVSSLHLCRHMAARAPAHLAIARSPSMHRQHPPTDRARMLPTARCAAGGSDASAHARNGSSSTLPPRDTAEALQPTCHTCVATGAAAPRSRAAA